MLAPSYSHHVVLPAPRPRPPTNPQPAPHLVNRLLKYPLALAREIRAVGMRRTILAASSALPSHPPWLHPLSRLPGRVSWPQRGGTNSGKGCVFHELMTTEDAFHAQGHVCRRCITYCALLCDKACTSTDASRVNKCPISFSAFFSKQSKPAACFLGLLTVCSLYLSLLSSCS